MSWKLIGQYTVVMVIMLGVFALYLSPDFLRTLADGVWACF